MKNSCPLCVLIAGLTVGSAASWAGEPAANGHWAFQPIRASQPPDDPSGWSVNAVDRLIRAKLRDHHLQSADLADKRALLRRATLDLLGLPPTPDEIEAFLANSSADAWSKVVERLLASYVYGSLICHVIRPAGLMTSLPLTAR